VGRTSNLSSRTGCRFPSFSISSHWTDVQAETDLTLFVIGRNSAAGGLQVAGKNRSVANPQQSMEATPWVVEQRQYYSHFICHVTTTSSPGNFQLISAKTSQESTSGQESDNQQAVSWESISFILLYKKESNNS
jgi:hypothetical protein